MLVFSQPAVSSKHKEHKVEICQELDYIVLEKETAPDI